MAGVNEDDNNKNSSMQLTFMQLLASVWGKQALRVSVP